MELQCPLEMNTIDWNTTELYSYLIVSITVNGTLYVVDIANLLIRQENIAVLCVISI